MEVGYRLLTYRDNGSNKAGVLVGELVYPAPLLLRGIDGIDTGSVLGLLRSWQEVHPRLTQATAEIEQSAGLPLAGLTLAAPILYPPAIFAAGGNYPDHLDEMARLANRTLTRHRVGVPFFTLKTAAHSIIGPDAPIRTPSFTRQLDYEAEIGVVIGRLAENLPVSRALEAVAGYVIVNDLSARDQARREALPSQVIHDWFGQKCFRDSMPMGPYLTPAADVPDPQDLRIRLWVNDRLRQDGNSRNMVHSIAEQIAHLSSRLTLQPGDVIVTGCPSGVGAARGEFLVPGDEIRIEVSHCGCLVNRVVAGE